MLLNFLTCHMFDQLFDEFFKEIVVPSSSHKECKRFFVTNECKIVHIASKFRSMKMRRDFQGLYYCAANYAHIADSECEL